MAVLTWLCDLFFTFTHLHADGAEIYIEKARRRVYSNTRRRAHSRPLCFSLLHFLTHWLFLSRVCVALSACCAALVPLPALHTPLFARTSTHAATATAARTTTPGMQALQHAHAIHCRNARKSLPGAPDNTRATPTATRRTAKPNTRTQLAANTKASANAARRRTHAATRLQQCTHAKGNKARSTLPKTSATARLHSKKRETRGAKLKCAREAQDLTFKATM